MLVVPGTIAGSAYGPSTRPGAPLQPNRSTPWLHPASDTCPALLAPVGTLSVLGLGRKYPPSWSARTRSFTPRSIRVGLARKAPARSISHTWCWPVLRMLAIKEARACLQSKEVATGTAKSTSNGTLAVIVSCGEGSVSPNWLVVRGPSGGVAP